MRCLTISLFVLTTLTAMVSSPSQACSQGYEKGWSPDEIKRRSDVRKVEGVFTLEKTLGRRFTNDEGEELIENGKYVGAIKSKRGRDWKTIHPLPWHLSDSCSQDPQLYRKPVADANGAFWITRRMKGGRYQILFWEGEHLPVPDKGKTKD